MSAEAGTPFYLEPDFHVAFHPQDSRCPSGNPYDIAQLSPLFFFFVTAKKNLKEIAKGDTTANGKKRKIERAKEAAKKGRTGKQSVR